MGWEIERRFLVRVSDTFWKAAGEGAPLRQGYIRNGTPSVRIRVGEARGPVLTCKSGSGIRRREVETVVPPEMAEVLMEAAEDRIIAKTRYRVGPWEVDRFVADLEGLELMEIELSDVEEVIPDPPSGIRVLREVTDSKTFVNGRLARLTPKEKQSLVARAYAGETS